MVSRLGGLPPRRGRNAPAKARACLCPALVPGCFVAWVYRTSSITPAAPHGPGYFIIYPSADSVISWPPQAADDAGPGQFAHPPQPEQPTQNQHNEVPGGVQHAGNTDPTALRGTNRHGCKNAGASL
jgi:hypothetical protein